MTSRSLLVTIALAGIAACGSKGPRAASPYDRERITFQEIQNLSAARTAYDVVQQLRPAWLSRRGQTSTRTDNPVIVYFGGAKVGGVERLQDLLRSDVLEIRHFDSVNATRVYGTGHSSGAIVVTLRSG